MENRTWGNSAYLLHDILLACPLTLSLLVFQLLAVLFLFLFQLEFSIDKDENLFLPIYN